MHRGILATTSTAEPSHLTDHGEAAEAATAAEASIFGVGAVQERVAGAADHCIKLPPYPQQTQAHNGSKPRLEFWRSRGYRYCCTILVGTSE